MKKLMLYGRAVDLDCFQPSWTPERYLEWRAVPGAPCARCGGPFGYALRRHRLFKTIVMIVRCHCDSAIRRRKVPREMGALLDWADVAPAATAATVPIPGAPPDADTDADGTPR